MADKDPPNLSAFELPRRDPDRDSATAVKTPRFATLPDALLARNVAWFCRLRWIVILVLAAFGALGFFPALCARLGMHDRTGWALAAAAALVVENLVFLLYARSDRPASAYLNLWCQIVFDLVVLTAVVHFTGSLETPIAFAYLFHIVLACIFFSRPDSLTVTVLAGVLYSACVTAEVVGFLSSAGIYADRSLRRQFEESPGLDAVHVVSSVCFWFVVWFLASFLSAMVRQRDSQLAETNRRLIETQRERSRHMLRTTHELKAPFAAIHANAQLLLGGYCGVMPEEALDVLHRIAARCRRLSDEIKEMLQLANLRSETTRESQEWTAHDSKELLDWCIGQVIQVAQERRVRIESDIRSVPVVGVEDHLKMVFMNLITNAVVYSRPGGAVHVRCTPAPDGQAVVQIEDHGIGIHPAKLPKIFDEYYRTDEAARHNTESTGLGLAIVKHVAEEHAIRVQVQSAPDVGTKFTLTFPTGTTLRLPAQK